MSGHLLTSKMCDQGEEASQSFNPLHVGAPTDIGALHGWITAVDVSIPSMSGHLLTSAFCRQLQNALLRFNPLHVGAPTDMGGDLVWLREELCFNPLHVGAPTDIVPTGLESLPVLVSIPSMSGHLLTSHTHILRGAVSGVVSIPSMSGHLLTLA